MIKKTQAPKELSTSINKSNSDMIFPIKSSYEELYKQRAYGDFWQYGAELPNFLTNYGITLYTKMDETIYAPFSCIVQSIENNSIELLIDRDVSININRKLREGYKTGRPLGGGIKKNSSIVISNIEINENIKENMYVDCNTILGKSRVDKFVKYAHSILYELVYCELRYNPEITLLYTSPRY